MPLIADRPMPRIRHIVLSFIVLSLIVLSLIVLSLIVLDVCRMPLYEGLDVCPSYGERTMNERTISPMRG